MSKGIRAGLKMEKVFDVTEVWIESNAIYTFKDNIIKARRTLPLPYS